MERWLPFVSFLGRMPHQATRCHACLIGFPLAHLGDVGMSHTGAAAPLIQQQIAFLHKWSMQAAYSKEEKKNPVRYLPAANK